MELRSCEAPEHASHKEPVVKWGGVILCGGQSARMGYPKAELPFGPQTLLQRAVDRLSQVVGPIAVVAAAEQRLPELPDHVRVARDTLPGEGPLEGLRVGLDALADCEAAYATSCDAPFVQVAFVRSLFAALEDQEVAVAEDQGFVHPLAAVYRPRVVTEVERLLAAGERRPRRLFQQVATARVPVEQLREVDPELDSLANLNRPEDYFAALERAGFEVTPAIRGLLGEAS